MLTRWALAAALWFVSGSARADEPVFHVAFTADKPGAVLERKVAYTDWAREKNEYLPRRRWVNGVTWQPLCLAPCDAVAETNTTFRVAGPHITPSDDFVLPLSAQPLTLHATTGSRRTHDAGLMTMGLGLAATIAGIVFLAAGDHDLRAAGLITGGVGLAGFATGATLFFTSQTTVEF